MSSTERNTEISKERTEFLLCELLSWVSEVIGNDDEELLNVLKNVGFTDDEIKYFS